MCIRTPLPCIRAGLKMGGRVRDTSPAYQNNSKSISSMTQPYLKSYIHLNHSIITHLIHTTSKFSISSIYNFAISPISTIINSTSIIYIYSIPIIIHKHTTSPYHHYHITINNLIIQYNNSCKLVIFLTFKLVRI